ncbi:hypothetical protein A1Q2_03101 [Trichosporon asahii var. asahii CBS 8904]|uniref:Uncharacterized protein n=1 Tax=Trichosporon asahii var. asahii (strain CBS 8904) TaxID=1220162 RepID=K1WNB0_TRIAC|nr:hypothetical protein A1Q2_03101 [Trichosporon asahii var. asahii CBS 8904]
MVATIHYAYFPGIFSAIIGHCDPKTQNKLRLLCSAVKLEINELHCRFITLYFDPVDEDENPGIPPEEVSLSVVADIRPKVPVLRPSTAPVRKGTVARNLAEGIDPAHAFALRCARGVYTWTDDLAWDLFNRVQAEQYEQYGLSYHSPFRLLEKATRMDIFVGDVSALETHASGPIPLPPCVRKLVLHVKGRDRWAGDRELVHACPTLRIEFQKPSLERRQLEQLGLGHHQPATSTLLRTLIVPCVELLVLIVWTEQLAISYLSSIKDRERHPDLRIVVATGYDSQPEEQRQLLQTLTEVIDADIAVCRLADVSCN